MTTGTIANLGLLASLGAFAGCFALDWDYEGPAGGGGAAASSSSSSAESGSTAASGAGGAGAGGGDAGGAGGGGEASPFFGDGSRLEANYFDYGGGARQFLDWFDTTLGVSCSFQRFATGDIACVPPANDASTYYADASCMQSLILYAPSSCAVPPAYGVISSSSTSCDNTPSSLGTPGGLGYTSIHAAGAPFTGATVYTKNGNTCTATAAPAPSASSTSAPRSRSPRS